MTSKGQVTVPADIRAKLNLQTGDRLDFEIDNGAIRVVPVGKGTLREFMGILPKSSRVVSVEEMNEAIAEGAAHGGS
jgi:AbrB family looped-hinge helix DNA binding protein